MIPVRRVISTLPALPALVALGLLASCRGPSPASGSPAPGSPSPSSIRGVPEGYHGLVWGTARARVVALQPDAHPAKANPKILVRDATVNGMPATEAYFFDSKDALEEVELRFTPKRTAAESAALGISMDASMGPHEVPLADDNAYQYAWSGQGSEVRLTYDLRESVAYGPVVAWLPHNATVAAATTAAATTAATAMPVAENDASGPGTRFASAVNEARRAGMHLVAVESGKGRLMLVYQSAGSATEITLTAEPKSKKLLGCARLPHAPSGAPPQLRAEAAIDSEIAKGEPEGLKFGGAAALRDLVTIEFKGGGYVSLRPGDGDVLAATSANAPR